MLNKSLIHFSVDGRGCVPSLLFDLRPNYGGGNEDNGASFKRPHACSDALSASNPEAGHLQPTPLPETPGHSWACLGQFLMGPLLLSPGSWCPQGFVCGLQESISPVLCKFWWFYGGVNGDFLSEGFCHTPVGCTQSPCLRPLMTCTFTGDTQTLLWLSLCGLDVHFVPFPGLSSSGDQVLGERTVSGGPNVLITSPVLAARFPWCAMRAPSQVCHMSPLDH